MLESRRVQKDNQNIESIVNTKNPIYYYGITCPYCRELEKFIEEKKVEEKVTLTKKEVYENQQNANELAKVAKYCRINSSEVGLPFILADKKCYVGLDEAKNYLSSYLEIKASSSNPQN